MVKKVSVLALIVGGGLVLALLLVRQTRAPEVAWLARGDAPWIVYPSPPAGTTRLVFELDTVFTRRFELPAVPARATLELTAFRHARLSVNGVAVPFPAPSTFREAARVDVRDRLVAGKNTIEIRVVNDLGPPALAARLETDGPALTTDARWTASRAGGTELPARLARAAVRPARLGPRNRLWSSAEALRERWPTLGLFAVAGLAMALGAGRLSRGRGRTALGAALLLAMALWIALVVNNAPSLGFSEGFDLNGHLEYIQYVLDHRAVPPADYGWSTFHPPLYYAVSAALLAATGTSLDDARAPTLLRLEALAFAVGLLVFAALCLRRLFPESPRRQVLGLLLAALLPMHLYMFQYVTNEGLAAMLSAAAFYFALRTFGAERPSGLTLAALGLCAGAALLTKFSALVLLAAIGIALAGDLAARRARPRVWLRTLGVPALACLAVAGWHFGHRWAAWGDPFVGNWDFRLVTPWWQDPGYQTSAYYLRFGRALVEPHVAGFVSFPDGIYSTFWGDALLGGAIPLLAPPWDNELLALGSPLALLPTLGMAIGLGAALVRLVRRPEAAWFAALGVLAAAAFALALMTLRIPSFAQTKAFYVMVAAVPVCALGAWGLDLLARARGLRTLVLAAFGTWALVTYATYWIPRGDGAVEARSALAAALRPSPERLERGEEHLRRARERAPDDELTGLAEVSLLQARGRLPEALEAARRLIAGHPESHFGALQHAQLALAAGARDEAWGAARRATELEPDDFPSWRLLGALAGQRGENELAIAALREAVRIDPTSPWPHEALAELYERTGDPAAEYHRALLAAMRAHARARLREE